MVEIWLGPAFDGSDDLIDAIAMAARTKEDIADLPKTYTVPEDAFLQYDTFIQLFQLPYWYRLWVMQEMVLGKTHLLRLGNKTLL